jgi:NADH dehydrogenase [ubiquinone] 1 alpha subcomplex assembly factor 1
MVVYFNYSPSPKTWLMLPKQIFWLFFGMLIAPEMKNPPVRILFEFKEPTTSTAWLIVNDGVMGGLSTSQMEISSEETALFQGHVTTANNGGFASVRTRPQVMDLKGFSGIRLRVKGDGKKYQFRIQTSRQFDGVAYRQFFVTERDQWQVLNIPFSDFVPVFRGRVLKDVPPLDPAVIQQIGFLLGDKQTGDFRLEVDWIAAY